MVDFVEHASFGEERIVERGGEAVDGRDRHMARQQIQPVCRRSFAKDCVQLRRQCTPVRQSIGRLQEASVFLQFGMADAIDQCGPELGKLCHHEHPSVGGAEHLARRNRRMRRSRCTCRFILFVHIPDGRIAGLMDGGG